jgi:NTE family protein
MPEPRPRVAIACQGGGSHTAFSAGALTRLLAASQYEFVAFSGTSGGAIDALLAWYGLLHGDGGRTGERLEAFWEDMSARSLPDYAFNQWAIAASRAVSPFFAPEISPYLYPSWAGDQLRAVIGRHVEFAEIPKLVEHSGYPIPALAVGAVDVNSGHFKVFKNEWKRGEDPTLEVTAEAILASAAIPTLFRAVRVAENGEEHLYWDGLFSQNPPVRDLPDAQPDQIWVLQINPTARRAEPRDMADIRDRRNELAGNLSLRQELHFIEKINKIVRGGRTPAGDVDATVRLTEVDAAGRPRTRTYKEITVFRIELEEHDLGVALDSESKLNRDPAFIRRLLACGERHADRFLAALANNEPMDAYRWDDDDEKARQPARA